MLQRHNMLSGCHKHDMPESMAWLPLEVVSGRFVVVTDYGGPQPQVRLHRGRWVGGEMRLGMGNREREECG